MTYIPHSQSEIASMLEKIGVSTLKELYEKQIPSKLELKKELNIEPGLTPFEVERIINNIGKENRNPITGLNFIGGGIYNHYVPPLVDELASRQEFYTAYTPYQPEVSQGTLTAIFEYQTMLALLSGLPISNASLYDGATALAEGVLLALRSTRLNTVAVAKNIHPEYFEVLKSYILPLNVKIIELPYDETTGQVLTTSIPDDKDLASIVVANPNFFGVIENLSKIKSAIKNPKTLFHVSVHEAMSLALLKSPQEFGANIVTGEAQSFGNYMNFGGPSLGFICIEESLLRNLPGRICGETLDKDGKRGFVFTLSTREQHIRREKATSNICSNENLIAIRTAMYLALMGESGLKNIAMLCASNAKYALQKLTKNSRIKVKFNSPFFNEFVVTIPDLDKLYSKSITSNIGIGIPLKKFFPNMKNELLISFTELNSKEDIENLIKALTQ